MEDNDVSINRLGGNHPRAQDSSTLLGSLTFAQGFT